MTTSPSPVQVGMAFNVKELKRIWSILRTVIPSKSALPILESVLVERVRGRINFVVTDLESSVIVHSPYAGDAPNLKMMVDFRSMSKLLAATEKGSITLEPRGGGLLDYVIKIGRGEYRFQGHDPLDYPQLPSHIIPLDLAATAVLKRRFVQECKRFVYPVRSRNALRPAMTQVYLNFRSEYYGGGVNAVVATDGHRMACSPIHGDDGHVYGHQPDNGFYLPPALFNNAGKLRGEEVSIYRQGGYSITICSDCTFIWHELDQTYPNYSAVIPVMESVVATVEVKHLIEICKRITVTSSMIHRQSIWNFKDDRLTISSEDPERNYTGLEWIPCETKGEMRIGFNILYAQDMFKCFGYDSVLKFSMRTPNKPVRVEEVNGDKPGRLFILMPVMLDL